MRSRSLSSRRDHSRGLRSRSSRSRSTHSKHANSRSIRSGSNESRSRRRTGKDCRDDCSRSDRGCSDGGHRDGSRSSSGSGGLLDDRQLVALSSESGELLVGAHLVVLGLALHLSGTLRRGLALGMDS
jgi:hypothetical protein